MNQLCTQKPTWKTEREHPLNTFMTTSERPQYVEDYSWANVDVKDNQTDRDKRLMNLSHNRKHSLQLAATMAL